MVADYENAFTRIYCAFVAQIKLNSTKCTVHTPRLTSAVFKALL